MGFALDCLAGLNLRVFRHFRELSSEHRIIRPSDHVRPAELFFPYDQKGIDSVDLRCSDVRMIRCSDDSSWRRPCHTKVNCALRWEQDEFVIICPKGEP